MFLDKSLLTESSYIAEDLLQGKLEDLSRKCIVVKQTVQDGDFTLEEALNLYRVSEADYKNFLAKSLIAELQTSFGPNASGLNMTYAVDVFAEVYGLVFSNLDKDAVAILKHFKNLSKKLKKHKVKI